MALIICKDCKKEISSDAKTCPHCGKKQSKPSWVYRGVGILIVVGALMSAYENATMTPEQKAEKASLEAQKNAAAKAESDESLVRLRVCKDGQKAITQLLKAPSSAKFPDCYGPDQFIVKQPDGTYTNTSYVDAQNEYGASIRAQFIISASAKGTDVTITDARLLE